jgi:uncharacterized protein
LNGGVPTTAVAAVPDTERIVLLDVVRGVALMGILVMNLPAFTAAGVPNAATQPLDHAAEVLRDMLFAGKFNSIFSLLFGLGFTLQLARLVERDPDRATAIYCRRLGWLLAIGLVHAALLWNGDVLHVYALLGFGLLWMRRWSDRSLVALMALCLFGPALSQLVRALLASHAGAAAAPLLAAVPTGWSAAEVQAFGQGSLLDVMRLNLQGFVSIYTQPAELRSHLGFIAQVLTTMALGLLIGRHGWVRQIPARLPQVVRLQRWALGLAVVFVGIYGLGHDLSQAAGASATRALVGTSYVVGRLALMAFYVLTLVRLMQVPAWQQRLAPFAAAGRMPLTNYLLQTLLCAVLFHGWGFGLWDRVGVAAEIPLALLLFVAVQLPLSVWWLRHHDQGPLERLWRRATYGRGGPPRAAAALSK